MKNFKLLFIGAFVLVLSLVLTACNDNKKPVETGYTVSFSVDGAIWQKVENVKKGSRVAQPTQTPTSVDPENAFIGWYREESCSTGWDFSLNIVSNDVTLYACWEKISLTPSQIQMYDEAFTSKLVWKQRNGASSNQYEVTLYPKQGKTYSTTGTVLNGQASFNPSSYVVTYTPNIIPMGGFYKVTVKDVTNGSEVVTVEGLLFGGEGTEVNPFSIGSEKEWKAISTSKTTVGTGKFYKVLANFSVTSSRAETVDSTFDGTIDGNNKTITHVTSNAGLIYRLGQNGKISNLEVAGEVTSGSWASIGGLVDYNSGLIENITVTGSITSTSGEIGNINQLDIAGAGGVVGTNEENGVIKNATLLSSSSDTGKVLANIGGGGIAGVNKGLITDSTNKGFIGANNELHSAKSTSRYSYLGGIAGVNYGTIQNSRTTAQGRVLAQRQLTENAGSTNTEGQGFNIGAGGITAFNAEGGLITDCYFDGIRVYADQAVGGIAGINDGTIQNSYAAGTYNTAYYSGINSTEVVGVLSYVGGRIEVGGIAGRTGATSVITNVYSTVNVHSFATPGYAIAPSANNSVYLTSVINAPYWSASDAGSNATKQESLVQDTLIAPVGTGNSEITNVKTVEVLNYYLTDSQLLTVLGEHFYLNDTTGIRLEYEKTIKEIVYVSDVYVNINDVETYAGEVNSSTMNVLTPDVTVKAVTGKYFAGWATEIGGEVVIPSSSINYSDVKNYVLDGEVTLYAVYNDLEQANTITVYYWATYVSPDISPVVDVAFKAYLVEQGFTNVENITIVNKQDSSKVAPFGEIVNADNTATILLGVGANIYTTGKVAYIERIEGITMKTNETTTQARMVARLQNTDLAVAFMEFLQTEAGAQAMLGLQD